MNITPADGARQISRLFVALVPEPVLRTAGTPVRFRGPLLWISEVLAGVGTEYVQGGGKVNDRLIIPLDLTMVVTGEEKSELESADLSS